METPTEQLFGAAHAQDVLLNMLTMINQQNSDIENLLHERYTKLQEFEADYSAQEARQLMTNLVAENNRLDEQLRQIRNENAQ